MPRAAAAIIQPLRAAIERTRRNNRNDRDDRRHVAGCVAAFPAFVGGAGGTAENALPGNEPAGAAAQLRSLPRRVALGRRYGDRSHIGPGKFPSAPAGLNCGIRIVLIRTTDSIICSSS